MKAIDLLKDYKNIDFGCNIDDLHSQIDEAIKELKKIVKEHSEDRLAELEKAGAPAIKLGVFANDTISFIILGFVMFMFIKSYNKLKKEDVVAAPTTKVCGDCAMEIPVAAKKCGHCGNTAV